MKTEALLPKIVAIGNRKDASKLTELLPYLSHSNGNVRRLTCSALGKLGSPLAERSLVGTLSDEKPQVRQYAISALGKVGTSYCRPILRKISGDEMEKSYNRKAAQEAVLSISKRESVQESSKVRLQPRHRQDPPVRPAADIELSSDQREVLREIWRWFVGRKSPFLTFGGYAGTGKTTLTAFFRNALKERFPELEVAFCSYTGKAARVLEHTLSKHSAAYPEDTSGTIHSLIYEPETNRRGRVVAWRKRERLKADLIIVDEASMVDAEIWADLRSFNIPILAVGDHGQLPPIRGDFNLMRNPGLRLERIHRQAEGNPIIKLSERVRRGGEIPFGDFGSVKKLARAAEDTGEIVADILSSYSDDLLVLVGYNSSRISLNNTVRRIKHRVSSQPQVGDRIICLRNNRRQGICNGMRGEVSAIHSWSNKMGQDFWYKMEAKMDSGVLYNGKVLKAQFNTEKTVQSVPGLHDKKMGDLFDFGYVLTVHKAQGSQAKKVLLFEERFKQMDDKAWHRWLYTAVTRAEEELIIIG